MKKLFVVLAILFIGILLAGCTSQTAAPVATPTATAIPTVVLTTAVPTPEPTKEVVVVVVNKTVNATPTATATPAPTYAITVSGSMVTPSTSATVKAGTKVVWTNTDPYRPHSIQAINSDMGVFFGGMNEVVLPYGESYAVTFDKVGTYDYTTVYYPVLTGRITVQ